MVIRIATASTGRPTAWRTATIVTIPAEGIPGAPIAVAIATNTITSCVPNESSIP